MLYSTLTSSTKSLSRVFCSLHHLTTLPWYKTLDSRDQFETKFTPERRSIAKILNKTLPRQVMQWQWYNSSFILATWFSLHYNNNSLITKYTKIGEVICILNYLPQAKNDENSCWWKILVYIYRLLIMYHQLSAPQWKPG